MPPGLVKMSKACLSPLTRTPTSSQASRATLTSGGSSVEHARADLDQIQRAVAKIGAQPELPHEQDDAASGVVKQNRGRRFVVIDLVIERADRAVVFLDFDA